MPSSIRKALNELPITLDDTYERALQGIPKEKRQHAHRLFQCLVGAIRPFRVEELAEIFTIDFNPGAVSNFMEGWRPENPEEAVLSTCSTLISVIDDNGSKIVQFSHFSVKEFLTSARLRMSGVGDIRHYHIPLDAAHTVLARACLAVLLQLDGKVDWKRLKTFPLVSYAVRHWIDHTKYEDVASRVQGAIQGLFDPKKPHLSAGIPMHNVAQEWHRQFFFSSPTHHPSPPGAATLFYAVLCGFSGVVDYLIGTHALDVNAHHSYSGAPLHVASGRGHAKVVHLLLQRNADVNVRCTSHYNWTPLHFASFVGHAKVVQLLLEHGADVNAHSKGYNTPLWLASDKGYVDVVRLLLAHGADVHGRGELRQTPFQRATANRHVEVAQLLLEHGAEKESVSVAGG